MREPTAEEIKAYNEKILAVYKERIMKAAIETAKHVESLRLPDGTIRQYGLRGLRCDSGDPKELKKFIERTCGVGVLVTEK